jgi:uncharacterized SAM-binding protein YcdF (DUF218 family)
VTVAGVALELLARALEVPLGAGRAASSVDPTGGAAPRRLASLVEARDAIVVLGAPLTASGRLSAILDERAAAAVALWRAGGAPRVVVTGGATRAATRAEADALAEALAAAGVPDVLVEREARSTADNARLTAALLGPLGARSVWLVTQPFHARRAAWLFRKAGLDARAWPIADSLQYRDRACGLRWLAREYGAWVALAAREIAAPAARASVTSRTWARHGGPGRGRRSPSVLGRS